MGSMPPLPHKLHIGIIANITSNQPLIFPGHIVSCESNCEIFGCIAVEKHIANPLIVVSYWFDLRPKPSRN